MHMHKPAMASSVALAAFIGLSAGAMADPIVLPADNANVIGGPTTQNQEQNALTGERQPDPYYQPKGIPLGGPWRLYPNLYSSLGYDDNVYRRVGTPGPGTGKVSSTVFEVDPTLVLDYDTNRAKIDLFGRSGFQDLEQYELWTYNVGVQGQYEISHDMQAAFSASDGLYYEGYSSPNTVVAAKRPNEYYLIDATGKFEYKPNRLGVSFGGSFDSYAFSQTPLIGGGAFPLCNVPPSLAPTTSCFALRNADIDKGWGQVSYDFSPGYSAFIKATYNDDQYSHLDTATFTDGVNRSSHGYSFDGGLQMLLGDLAKGDLYVGYLEQFYDKNQAHPLNDVSGFDFGADLTWYPTELLTVRLSGARQLQNTTLTGASAADDRSGTLSADYELLRRLHLDADVGYDDTNYKGSGREDQTLSAGIGGKFLMSHYVWLNAHYEYQNRSSSLAGGHYTDNFVFVGLNLQD